MNCENCKVEIDVKRYLCDKCLGDKIDGYLNKTMEDYKNSEQVTSTSPRFKIRKQNKIILRRIGLTLMSIGGALTVISNEFGLNLLKDSDDVLKLIFLCIAIFAGTVMGFTGVYFLLKGVAKDDK